MENLRQFICTVCLKNPKKWHHHLMCPRCNKDYDELVEKIKGCSVSSTSVLGTRFEYVMKKTIKNLNSCQDRFDIVKLALKTYWDEAFSQVKFRCRGKRMENKAFLSVVEAKFRQILESRNLQKEYKELQELKFKLAILDSTLNWLERIASAYKSEAENVVQETAVA